MNGKYCYVSQWWFVGGGDVELKVKRDWGYSSYILVKAYVPSLGLLIGVTSDLSNSRAVRRNVLCVRIRPHKEQWQC
jgi:hypothetical protein